MNRLMSPGRRPLLVTADDHALDDLLRLARRAVRAIRRSGAEPPMWTLPIVDMSTRPRTRFAASFVASFVAAIRCERRGARRVDAIARIAIAGVDHRAVAHIDSAVDDDGGADEPAVRRSHRALRRD